MPPRTGAFNRWIQQLAEKRAHQIANPLLPWLERGSGPILDFGSGLGHVGSLAAQHTGRPVTYLDIKDYPYTAPGVKITVFDGKTIPFPEESFETSLGVLVFHHTPNPPAALAEVARVTKTSLVVCEDAIAGRRDFYVEAFKDTVTNCFLPHVVYQYRTEAEWEALFAASGLAVQDKTHFTSHYIFDFQHVAWYLSVEK